MTVALPQSATSGLLPGSDPMDPGTDPSWDRLPSTHEIGSLEFLDSDEKVWPGAPLRYLE
jgi:hypothetical protein